MNITTLPISGFVLTLFGIVGAQAIEVPPDIVLQAKIRDFKEANPTDPAGTHPHFNTQTDCSAFALGVRSVQEDIDTTGTEDDGSYPGDKRSPRLMDSLPASIAGCFIPTDRFSEWYSDQAPEINRSFLVELKFARDEATGVYRYQDSSFFPIDDGKPFKKFSPTDPDPFGNLQTGIQNGVDVSKHNYGFTMELHTEFLYNEGKAQVFTFRGDDDIWVYINGKCVLDRGGIHPTEGGEANLDSLKSVLGLVDGGKYPLDFFFAERHTSSSTCTISTNLSFLAATQVVAIPKATPGASDLTEFPGDVTLTSETADAKIFYTLDGSEPDSTKSLYTSPLTIPAAAVLKAIAYRSGWFPSPIQTESYADGSNGIKPRLSVAHPGIAAVSIFDRSGRLVRSLPAQTWAGIPRSWDLRAALGAQASSGIYFWRSRGTGSVRSQSGTLLIP
ncbi:MAG: fibro-slime domain-containing protein [Fibrobacteria bacterium]